MCVPVGISKKRNIAFYAEILSGITFKENEISLIPFYISHLLDYF